MASIRRLLSDLLPAALLITAGCYDPPVRERVMLTVEPGGRLVLSVETTFKQGRDLKEEEQGRIQHAVDLYELGRDPWIRGFDRAFAVDVTHEYIGPRKAPQGIARRGSVPSVESLADLMPDAIANFKLSEDPEEGTRTLRIIHIDLPESLRENRRQVEREMEAFAAVGFRFSERECDLYDYLAERVDRRRDVLRSLDDEAHIEGMLTPEETVLRERLREAFEGMAAFGEDRGKRKAPVVASLSFSAFEHDFCVKLPAEATIVIGLAGGVEEKERTTYCAPRLTLEDLHEVVVPEAEPSPMDHEVLGKLLDDPVGLAAAPFTCHRYDDAKSLERKIWARILPLPCYELTWSTSAPKERKVACDRAIPQECVRVMAWARAITRTHS
ncbi:MAG TPA: hypothetical protein VGK94_04450 [Candidatus Polarisedimenticolia bacterium]|jgi:hypothetical protein